MSELGERRWAVISERGCEAAGLVYADAARLVRQLLAERVSGLCIVTDFAASHLRKATPPTSNGKRPAKTASGRRRRPSKTS